jgi:hypothetical protein
MYNGIGLLTPRGSGTSGYVQANKFNLRGRPQQRVMEDRSALQGPEQKRANQAILDHNRKRDIELKLTELADSLEEQGCARAGPCGRGFARVCAATPASLRRRPHRARPTPHARAAQVLAGGDREGGGQHAR